MPAVPPSPDKAQDGRAAHVVSDLIVVLNDRFLEFEIFLVGDDLLLVGAVEVSELLADACFVFTAYLGAAEATGETASSGEEDDAGEEGLEIHFAKYQMAVGILAAVASAVRSFW